ncbi:hypothetical protein A5886_002338 [Enterococcus sp. 8G7_MSG3316]|uniref:Uncharacterized protein n=1 Tax=Candidatus Enterococcus testudinis TaxID=1834191 RepID=A0A242A937_9ENTE|nr:hypothetical protein [Enterococcus sp. 8G7_MSG3316]OTN77241.1 hypothetical protein A5886_002338 [Enterococcus sp. 8G7_MSG3316]
MTYRHIEIFTISQYNKNKEKKGYFPQSGVVINVFFEPNFSTQHVAVGFNKVFGIAQV